MIRIIKKPKTPNMVWDTANNRLLCKFVKGVIETNDEALAEKLKALGYEVTGEVDKVEPEMDVEQIGTTSNDVEQVETATEARRSRSGK